MIKVKDLVEALSKYDPELPVLAAADDEGNYYHPVYLPSEYYCPYFDGNYIEQVYPKEYFDDAVDEGHTPTVNCLVM